MSHEPHAGPAPELWAGVECTVNRVGDKYYDQLERTGHDRRPEDLELIASLGVSAVRYPVLWERTAPGKLRDADWTWPDARLARLRELNLRPIVGLLHHGSGPRHTSLVDPEMPLKLASYARAVAERYPWVEDFTPINEPLTTARFSGLYGHWYPHGRDDVTFVRSMLVQARAVVLAMRAVREVNPAARLVQTEDLGKTFSTARLRYQAEFENERRWLSFDLLTGRVSREHALWNYLRASGAAERELEWFRENPCPPDLLGVNHYVTSERFLDERLERYPPRAHGGNGRHRYADVEAVRVCAEGAAGPRALLREAWERYGLPLAVTEAHIGCTREEQLRWLKEVWTAASDVSASGADVRAVTAWAVFGSCDWDSLAICDAGRYEPGAFDVRGPRPRPTALAGLLRELAAGGMTEDPLLDTPGWWRRMDRLAYPPFRGRTRGRKDDREEPRARGAARPLLITGATGTLGGAFARLAGRRGLSYRLLSRQDMDIADRVSVERVLEEYNPWAVVNAAGYVRVDDAEREAESCFRENTLGAKTLAEACARTGARLLTFSSDLVFGGERERREPYVERHAPSPVCVYGRSKAEAERLVSEALPGALVVRTSAFFGPWDEYNFVHAVLRALSVGAEFVAAEDYWVSPTYVPDLAGACLDLLIDGERGVWHLSNAGGLTWADFARRAAEAAGLDPRLVKGRPVRELNLAAPRPSYTVLASERGTLLPPLDDALARYVNERVSDPAERPARHVV